MNEHEALVDQAVRTKHTVLLIGGMDTGKTTLSRELLAAALAAGRPAALLDADVGQKTVGPPATISLKVVRSPEDLEPEPLATSDALYFVGSTSAQGHLLPVVGGVASLHEQAKQLGADFIVVDSSGLVSGITGQTLKYHKVEALRPDLVVGLQRGEELAAAARRDPAVLRDRGRAARRSIRRSSRRRSTFGPRTASVRCAGTSPASSIASGSSPRCSCRRSHRCSNPATSTGSWSGCPTAPGGYPGIGYLEHAPDEGVLRLISPVAEGPKALRLGSVRLDASFGAKRVDLRNLFGSE